MESLADLPVEAPKITLSEVETHFIEVFVSAAEALSIPRSFAEIYGVIFASPHPMTFQDIVDRLNLSKGSVSNGLKSLRSLGAVRVSYHGGDRRDYYTPETELRQLVAGLLRDRITPHLDQGRRSLEQLQATVAGANTAFTAEELKVLRVRAEKLETWRKQAALITPFLSKFVF